MSSTSTKVLAPLIVGFALLILFGVWETLEKVKYPLCPPRIFRSHMGREFTVPFIVAFIVTMFYYGINVSTNIATRSTWLPCDLSDTSQS